MWLTLPTPSTIHVVCVWPHIPVEIPQVAKALFIVFFCLIRFGDLLGWTLWIIEWNNNIVLFKKSSSSRLMLDLTVCLRRMRHEIYFLEAFGALKVQINYFLGETLKLCLDFLWRRIMQSKPHFKRKIIEYGYYGRNW